MRFDRSGDVLYQLDRILNEGIELEDNVRGGYLEFVTTGEEQELEHNLGYVPIGYLVILKTLEADIWATKIGEWNNTTLFLQSNVTNATVRIFVM